MTRTDKTFKQVVEEIDAIIEDDGQLVFRRRMMENGEMYLSFCMFQSNPDDSEGPSIEEARARITSVLNEYPERSWHDLRVFGDQEYFKMWVRIHPTNHDILSRWLDMWETGSDW